MSRRADFHTHTLISDGALTLPELVQRARVLDHRFLAVTDHVGLGDIESTMARLRAASDRCSTPGLEVVVGVEITHVPPRRLDEAVRRARRAGARIVLVHGETVAEPVAPGTNRAAVQNPEVDLLAHPGLLDLRDAERARAHGIHLEISGRTTHGLANGRVVGVAEASGTATVVNSDAHEPSHLLTQAEAFRVARATGATLARARRSVSTYPDALVRRLRQGGR
ncbi:MAG: histidinol phosphate phosphatase domain-containing protein [Thermoplasmata archaeon]